MVKRGEMKVGLMIGLAILFLIFLLQIQEVEAGPYGYGDSMDLHYEIDNDRIIYSYGNETKYATSLRPKNINWTEWKLKSRREVVPKEEKSTILKSVIELEVLERLKSSEWISVIIELNSNSEQLISLILSDLSTSEFKLKEKLLGNEGFAGEITKDGLEKLINNPDVRIIYLDRVAQVLLQESLPLINATKVWTEGYTGKDQTICVIDTGVNYTHPDLGGCFGSGCKVIGGYDEFNNDGDPMDDNGHGTHVAGIAAANGSINGTAPDAKIVAMKACNAAGTNCPTSDIANSITWCVNNKDTYDISVISISIGNNESYTEANCPTELRTQINNAYAQNISVFISSGNNGFTNGISWPACRGNVTSVGAVYDANVGIRGWCTQTNSTGDCVQTCNDFSTAADKIVCFTNRGSNLDLLAPGSVINSTYVNGGYFEDSGTSQAAPHVAGAAALLLERDPTLTPAQIETALKNTTKYISNYPRIDVLSALNSLCEKGEWTAVGCGDGDPCSSFQKEYTRTVDPAGCAETSKCEYDESCVSGSTITVCASGCDVTTVQAGLDLASYGDLVKITDSGVYDEDLNWSTSDNGVLLNCQGATLTSGWWNFVIHEKDEIAIINCIINSSSGIKVTGDYYSPYEIKNNVLDIEQTGIDFNGNLGSIEIWDNIIINPNEEGIYFHNDAGNSNIKRNSLLNNYQAIYLSKSSLNTISDNIFEDNSYGVYLKGFNYNLDTTISNNNISENDYGIYIDQQGEVTLNNNFFCDSNSNYDIYTTSMQYNSGTGNTCEKPDGWNDTSVEGCTYYCDEGAQVILLDPLDESTDIDGNIDFTCQASDNDQLVNITLYHNITGAWQANQTESISGISNTTTFSIENIADGTFFSWNCLAYDNISRGNFASENWTINVLVINNYPTYSDNLTSPVSPVVYSPDALYEFNISWTDDNLFDTALLEFDGVNYTMSNEVGDVYNISFLDLAVGNYEYKFLGNDSASQLNVTDDYIYSITQNTTSLILAITPSNSETYGTGTTATGIGCPEQLTCELFRDDVGVSNPETDTFGVGSYVYIYNTTGNDNYTSDSETDTLTISQATSEVYAWINGTRANYLADNRSADDIYLNGTFNSGQGIVELWLDGELINNGTAPVYNTTTPVYNTTNLSIGYYEFNATFNGNENYTDDVESWWINITEYIEADVTFPTLTINYPANATYGAINADINEINFTAEDETALSGCWYSTDNGDTNSTINDCYSNFTSVTSLQGSNNFTVWANDTGSNEQTASVVFVKDTYIPVFSNYWDDNSSHEGTGQTGNFSVDVIDTNGTVLLQINNTNYTAENYADNKYNVSVLFDLNGTWSYYWISYSNFSQNINTSEDILNFYTINNTPDITAPEITIIYPENITYNYAVENLNYTIDELGGSCWYSMDSGDTNSSFSSNGANFTDVLSVIGSNNITLWCNDTIANEQTASVVYAYLTPDNPPNTTLVSPTDNSVDEDGTVTFNCSATDDSNLVNITLYGDWSGEWYANETKSLSGISDSATFTKTLTNGIYTWNCLTYDVASQNDWADANRTINISIIPPNDTYKFVHKNNSGDNVAWLGNLGNIVLKGNCISGGTCTAPPDSFIIANFTDNTVAYIDNQGNLCIETGDCSDQSTSCNPTRDAFIIRNSSNYNMSYIDFNGDLCLTGKLYENSNP